VETQKSIKADEKESLTQEKIFKVEDEIKAIPLGRDRPYQSGRGEKSLKDGQ